MKRGHVLSRWAITLSLVAMSNMASVFPQTVQQRAVFDLSTYHVTGDCTKPVCTLDRTQAK